MCGIVGGYARENSDFTSEKLNSAIGLLRHRGPDSSGESTFELGSNILRFGFSRLAVIDLSHAGNQPFTSSDKRFTMVFNGEIYNYLELKQELLSKGHTFRTNSDSEVLIRSWAEWGIEAVKRFIGMFSVVIYDSLKSELWCIRDAYGIKPFFYSYSNNCFFFASEIPALSAIRGRAPRMNRDTALRYIIDGDYDRSSQTFFDDIFQLQPGNYLKIDLKDNPIEVNPKRWWLPKFQENNSISFRDAAEALRVQFLESLKLHLRSDVRIATALSGGLDSSSIVSAIRALEPNLDIHTFSYSADDPSLDESQWIKLVNSSTNSIPHSVNITPSEFYSDLDDLIRCQGEPFGSTSLYAQYRIYKAAKAEGVTVMLDGQGADELLAGYFGYPENRIRSLLDNHDYLEATSLMLKWSKWPGRKSRYLSGSMMKYLLPDGAQLQARRLIQKMSVYNFVKKDFHHQVSFPDVYPDYRWSGRRLAERLLKEQSNGALIRLLRHADRNSMRWSIESRVPFLNTKLSELVLSFPEDYLLSPNGETKSVFREAMRGIVDQRILDRKDKIGFATPQGNWITKEFLSKQRIMEGSESIDFFNRRMLDKYLFSESKRSFEKVNTIWRIVNLIKWREIMGIN